MPTRSPPSAANTAPAERRAPRRGPAGPIVQSSACRRPENPIAFQPDSAKRGDQLGERRMESLESFSDRSKSSEMNDQAAGADFDVAAECKTSELLARGWRKRRSGFRCRSGEGGHEPIPPRVAD